MSARGETDFLEKVRAVADIREIISGYLPLKKSGSRYRGLCPFHQEKTPSFYVDAGKQLFYCFGCGTGGDAFKFLMLYEKVEFPDALRILARRYGVTIPERSGGLTSERQVLLKVNRAALEYFRTILQSETEGKRGADYLVRRNLSKETIEEFGLGFAPDRWDGVKQTLLAAGFAEAQLLSAGVVLKKEDTGRTYDRFRNRLIFPILGLSGECLGFGGRMIGEGEPKYLNSPETPVFRKGDNLYGLSHSGEAVRKAGFAVLVEGYIDFLSLYQAGFRNLVATLGTGFTPGHAKLLGRFTRRIVVNFDPDSAGRAATRRSLDILLESGFDVRVLCLPGGKDPDRFIQEDGPENYSRLLSGAPPYIEYLAREAAARLNVGTTAGKIEALDLVLPYVARLESPVERSEQAKLLADLFRIEDGVILQELKRALAERRSSVNAAPPPEAAAAPAGPAIRLLRVLVENVEARQALVPTLKDEDLAGTDIERIWPALKDLLRSGSEVSYPRLGSSLKDAEVQSLLLRIAAAPGPEASLPEGEACLRRLKEAGLARRMREVQSRLEATHPEAKVDELLREKMELRREIQDLRKGPAALRPA